MAASSPTPQFKKEEKYFQTRTGVVVVVGFTTASCDGEQIECVQVEPVFQCTRGNSPVTLLPTSQEHKHIRHLSTADQLASALNEMLHLTSSGRMSDKKFREDQLAVYSAHQLSDILQVIRRRFTPLQHGTSSYHSHKLFEDAMELATQEIATTCHFAELDEAREYIKDVVSCVSSEHANFERAQELISELVMRAKRANTQLTIIK